MPERITQTWVYLSATPLFWLTMTLVAYQIAHWIYRRCGAHPLANPVLIAVVLLVALLQLTHTPYDTYFSGAQFVHFLLGPATVALAIPLYGQFQRLVGLAGPLLLALVGGSLTAMLSAVFVGHWLGGSLPTLLSLAPKSVTTPIAMGIAERIGGHPSLAAVMVIATGILGAITAQTIFRWLKVNDDAVSGFALGVAAHGIGTARAFQLSETMGAFAALGMGLNGLLTAISLPSLIQWLKPWLQ
ncbi:MAG: LrgB family protein [Rhodocyclaceae bacterium]|jgi:predicted murein hydrolase (TIGR00659 family)|uniref:Membrane protein n=1 Tax=Fluviibacter phosphoraccumulans TaxID=1751046 RepID=A0A679HYT9_9RHOO|nr:LrgB family protein [Fluviibacter phosphoraccumulans]MBP7917868.1 LrgB family protein [Rhodocyclaceae bacterium]MBP7991966.1 LrgB family protein [Rhodocyclaceae bacterium]BBU67858.1 membrane protein [Fluviibacter phosphoraccumulans]BBU70603.1 membrane protein [Fluviibacter phosphoraccumulans]BCA66047.1 membrane protein [Fluviibacter phosphoraccumulans]